MKKKEKKNNIFWNFGGKVRLIVLLTGLEWFANWIDLMQGTGLFGKK